MKKTILIFVTLCVMLVSATALAPIINSPKIKGSGPFLKSEIKRSGPFLKILFIGDIMMDRSIRTRAEWAGYDHYFECVVPFFSNYDFIVANLEGAVTNYPSVSEGITMENPNHYRFTMSPDALIAMNKAGINVLGVANNHIYDFGREGISETRKNILEQGLYYFGDPINEEGFSVALEKNGIKFLLVPYNAFFDSKEKTVEKIRQANSLLPIIVFAHWGEEYVLANVAQKNLAQQLIREGADLIIGTHPHVVQETEEIDGVFTAYSLGNFIFDQYWMDSVKEGLMVEAVIDENQEIKTRVFNTKLDEEKRPCN